MQNVLEITDLVLSSPPSTNRLCEFCQNINFKNDLVGIQKYIVDLGLEAVILSELLQGALDDVIFRILHLVLFE